LHWGELRTVSSFSLNLTGYNIFNFFARNADYLLIGRFLGATQLGLYTLAYRIMLYPVQRLTVVVNRVLFPVYSQLQQDPERFRRAYLKTIGMIAAIAFPAMMGLWVVAEPMVHVVFGSKWQGAVPVLQILVPIGLMQSVGATVGPVYQAKGRTDLLFRWGLASGILVVAAFVIGLRWGIVGVAFAYLVCNFICLVPNLYIPLRLISLPLSRLAAVVSRPLLGSVLMAGGLVGVRALLPHMSHSFALQFLVPLGIVAYIGISLVLNREQVRQALDMLRVRSGAN
jgi:PST family polysaccharide transporter